MVNKKLTEEDEDRIYYEHLMGKSLSVIANNYPVVVSTIQRVIKRKSLKYENLKRNYLITNVFKYLKNSNNSLELSLKLFKDNEYNLHEIQKEYLLDLIKNIHENIESLLLNIGKENI